MKDVPSKPPAQTDSDANSASANRRRVGRVVRDDRGLASVEWHDAPANQPRTVLEIEDTTRAQRRLKSVSPGNAPAQDPGNPYQRAGGTSTHAKPRRDLQKLSQWMKMMREIEARKRLDVPAAKEPTDK